MGQTTEKTLGLILVQTGPVEGQAQRHLRSRHGRQRNRIMGAIPTLDTRQGQIAKERTEPSTG